MKIINNKYKLLEKIGSGSFGSIYKAENIRTNELVAIKVESIQSGTKLLKNESIIYQYLANIKGLPNIKWFGKDDTNYYMVINLLGPSLQNLKDNKGNFSLKLTLQIGIKILFLLKTIHEKGLIHRDIKPDNFLLGVNENCKDIYIIDFGFCKSYIDNTNPTNHIEMTNITNMIGSITYASINAHKFIQLSRRDDLESLGYMLLYLHLGSLKWQNIDSNTVDKNHIVLQLKEELTDNTFLPIPISNYLKNIRKLEYEETPNYEYLIGIFKQSIDL